MSSCFCCRDRPRDEYGDRNSTDDNDGNVPNTTLTDWGASSSSSTVDAVTTAVQTTIEVNTTPEEPSSSSIVQGDQSTASHSTENQDSIVRTTPDITAGSASTLATHVPGGLSTTLHELINTPEGEEAGSSTQTSSLVTTSLDEATSVWQLTTSSLHTQKPVTTTAHQLYTETLTTQDLNAGLSTKDDSMALSTSVSTEGVVGSTTTSSIFPSSSEQATTPPYEDLFTTELTSIWTNITWLYNFTNSTFINSSLDSLSLLNATVTSQSGTTETVSNLSDVTGVSSVTNSSLILSTLLEAVTTEPLVVTSSDEYSILSDEPLIIILPVVFVVGCPMFFCLYVACKSLVASIRGKKKSKVAPQQTAKPKPTAHEMKPRYKNRTVAFDGTKAASKGL